MKIKDYELGKILSNLRFALIKGYRYYLNKDGLIEYNKLQQKRGFGTLTSSDSRFIWISTSHIYDSLLLFDNEVDTLSVFADITLWRRGEFVHENF